MSGFLPFARRAIAALRQSARILATERELRAMSPVLLRDIGVLPDDIPAVAAGLVKRPQDPQGQPQAASCYNAIVVTLPQRRQRTAQDCAPACCAA